MLFIEKIIRIKIKDKTIPIQDVDIENELENICEREHCCCNEDCPIYRYIKTEDKCKYKGSGKNILKLLRRRYKQEQE